MTSEAGVCEFEYRKGPIFFMLAKVQEKPKNLLWVFLVQCDYFSEFSIGAFINKRARLLQSLVFFFFFKDRLEATNVNVQLKETKLIPGKRI